MNYLLQIIVITIWCMIQTNGECSGTRSGSAIEDDFEVQISMDCDTEIVRLSIQYKDFSANWFGIVFHHSMFTHPSLVYTTGKAEDRLAALYAYDLTSKLMSGVTYNENNDWTEVDTITESNYIHIIYEQELSNTEWDIDTASIGFRIAVGTSLKLERHNFKTEHATIFLSTDGDIAAPTYSPVATTIEPTQSPTNSNNGGCGGASSWFASDSFGDFDVILTINCATKTVQINMTYNAFNDNWFGIVFNNEMLGNALIYTSGKANDIEQALYLYTISQGKSLASVTHDATSDWTEIETKVVNSAIQVIYEQDLNLTAWNEDTTAIPMRWAFGPQSAGFQLVHHEDRSSDTRYFDFITGETRSEADDLSLQHAHGVIMWIAWSVFASIGIMGSAFRWIFPSKPKGLWFQIHRGAQCMVLLLHLIGFVIAVVFTEDNGVMHFHNNHMKLGLVVTILVVLQPLNAFFRPHPANKNEKKPLGRLIWEIVHKLCGYSAWILAAITIYMGLNLSMIDEETLAYVHLFGWCGFMVIVYIILSVVGCMRKKQEDHIEIVNDKEDDDMNDPQESDRFVNHPQS